MRRLDEEASSRAGWCLCPRREDSIHRNGCSPPPRRYAVVVPPPRGLDPVVWAREIEASIDYFLVCFSTEPSLLSTIEGVVGWPVRVAVECEQVWLVWETVNQDQADVVNDLADVDVDFVGVAMIRLGPGDVRAGIRCVNLKIVKKPELALEIGKRA